MIRNTALAALLAPVLLGAAYLAACTGDDPILGPDDDAGAADGATPPADGSAGSDTGTGTDAGAPTFAAAPVRPHVRIAGSTSVELTLTRRGIGGEIPITVSKLPTGVTASANPIPSSGTTTTLKIDAAANATTGNATITVSAPGVADFALEIVVAGAPGSRDTAFETGLVVAPGTDAYNAVAVLADRRVVVAGSKSGGGWVVRRYDATGKADAAFESAAAAVLPASGAADGIAIDPTNGKIVIVGSVPGGGGNQGTIVRLLASGGPDLGFATAGRLTVTDHPPPGASFRDALVGPGESVVIVGRRAGPMLVERYTSAGTRDSAFLNYADGDGSFRTIVGLDGGTMLAAGSSILSGPPVQVVRKMNANGTLDTTYGDGGVREVASDTDTADLALLTGGDALLVGTSVTSPTMFASKIPTSGNGGPRWTQSTGGSNPTMAAAAAGPNDRGYAIGLTGGASSEMVVAARLGDGGLDTTFGIAGSATVTDSTLFPRAAATGDGRLFVAGTKSGSAFLFAFWE